MIPCTWPLFKFWGRFKIEFIFKTICNRRIMVKIPFMHICIANNMMQEFKMLVDKIIRGICSYQNLAILSNEYCRNRCSNYLLIKRNMFRIILWMMCTTDKLAFIHICLVCVFVCAVVSYGISFSIWREYIYVLCTSWWLFKSRWCYFDFNKCLTLGLWGRFYYLYHWSLVQARVDFQEIVLGPTQLQSIFAFIEKLVTD